MQYYVNKKSLANLKIIFIGSTEISSPFLYELEKEKCLIRAVITKPDKKYGRGQKISLNPVKELALQLKIPIIFQPPTLKNFAHELKKIDFDLIVVVAYGLIIPAEIIDMGKFGSINVHFSLLPRWRGPAPVVYAILAGDNETGVTIMQMDEGLDTGDIITQERCLINKMETTQTLTTKLIKIGKQLLIKTINDIRNGTSYREKQSSSDVTNSYKIDKEIAKIDWQKSAPEIDRKIRAFYPKPKGYTFIKGREIKIIEAELIEKTTNQPPGTILIIKKKGIEVATIDGVIQLLKLQFLNGKILTIEQILCSKRELFINAKLG